MTQDEQENLKETSMQLLVQVDNIVIIWFYLVYVNFVHCLNLVLLPSNISNLLCTIYVTLHGKTYTNDFPLLNGILLTTICKPFEKFSLIRMAFVR